MLRTVENDWSLTPPVFPVFILINESNSLLNRIRPERIWKDFNQIETNATNLAIHGGSFIFPVPPQNFEVIQQIQNAGHRLKIALYRSLDGTYSENAFNFDYVQHFDGCPFCEIRLGMFHLAFKSFFSFHYNTLKSEIHQKSLFHTF